MNELFPPPSFIPPEVDELAALFPAYEISHWISSGGMGAVYCATQKSLDRTVAIKILPRELSADVAFRDGFVAEAKAMARLNHPNLIGVYDFGEVDGMLFIIMEFVPGQSIHHSAHGIAIDPLVTISLVSSICHGLAHAHENGIVHRDIKPANILLDLNAQPKIGDFGLARPFDQMVHEGDEIYGTPHYTAPEVIHPPYTATYRADIYSVGIMLHELLTGSLPTPDQQPASSIVHCDARFDAIIRRSTKPNPEYRYSNANEMANDLIAIANTRPLIPTTYAHPIAPPTTYPAPIWQQDISIPSIHVEQRTHENMIQSENKSSGIANFLKVALAVILGFFAYKQYQKYSNYHIVTMEDPVAETRTDKQPVVNQESQPAHPKVAPSLTQEPLASQPLPSQPEIDPVDQPAMAQESESATAPYVHPEIDPKTASELDAFYERARKIMKSRAASILAENAKQQQSILVEYQKEVKREIRNQNDKLVRDRLDAALDVFIKNCRNNHNTLPDSPDTTIASQINIVRCHMEAVQSQRSLHDVLAETGVTESGGQSGKNVFFECSSEHRLLL